MVAIIDDLFRMENLAEKKMSLKARRLLRELSSEVEKDLIGMVA